MKEPGEGIVWVLVKKKTKRQIFIDTAAAPKQRADELPGKPGEAERESRPPFISDE